MQRFMGHNARMLAEFSWVQQPPNALLASCWPGHDRELQRQRPMCHTAFKDLWAKQV